MQAHPQSSPAARISSASPKTSRPATFVAPPQPQPRVRHLVSPAPPIGLADAAGLAHDAGNLLGALSLYCDLLRAPGVLRPEHSHYATELGLISSRSSTLIQRLLGSTPTPPPCREASALHIVPHATPQPFAGLLQPRADHATLNPAASARSPQAANARSPQPSDVRRRSFPSSQSLSPSLSFTAVLRQLEPVLQRIAAGAATVCVLAPSSLPAPHHLPPLLTAETLERITVNLVRNAAEAIRSQRSILSGLQPNDPKPNNLQPHDLRPNELRPNELRPKDLQLSGEIRIALAIVAGRLQLSVEDNGPGIPPGIAAAFLQPTPLPAGTRRGLGHRIVHELVTSSGGQLSIRVRPGQGSAFCIKWPLADSSPESPSTPIPSGPLALQKGSAQC